VVTEPSFTLLLENRADLGPHDNTVYDAFLVASVNDPALLDEGSLILPDGTELPLDPASLQLGTPTLPCSGRTAPPHSVYPAHFTTVALGDIGAGEVLAIGVEITGEDGLEAHFDAIGISYRQTGQGLKCSDVINPSGHDVSVVLGDVAGPPCQGVDIVKEASATGIDLGEELEYVITVTNTGTCELTEVVVTDEVPTVSTDDGEVPAFTVLTADPPATVQSELELVWELGTLAPGHAVTIVLEVVFDEPAADQTHVLNLACVNAAELDHRSCDRVSVAVGEVGDEIGGPGFWCNQIRFTLEGRDNALFTLDELDGWLIRITDESLVFVELFDVSSLELAQVLLCSPSQAEGPADRLARHLLTLWFNVASERVDNELVLGDLCAGSVPEPPDMDPAMTIAEVLTGAEQALLDGADDAILVAWAELVDYINNASVAGENGCGRIRRMRGRH
jgi:uncharacterized repeat protein (TIGR01451 family)